MELTSLERLRVEEDAARREELDLGDLVLLVSDIDASIDFGDLALGGSAG